MAHIKSKEVMEKLTALPTRDRLSNSNLIDKLVVDNKINRLINNPKPSKKQKSAQYDYMEMARMPGSEPASEKQDVQTTDLSEDKKAKVQDILDTLKAMKKQDIYNPSVMKGIRDTFIEILQQ